MSDHELESLGVLVGKWTIEGKHRALPDTVIRGSTSFEWLVGRGFLVWRFEIEPAKIPSGIALLGGDDDGDALVMHYFDSRGVMRRYGLSMREGVWRMWRDAPAFRQRFTGTFTDGGNTIQCLSELATDGAGFERDLEMTYRRVPTR